MNTQPFNLRTNVQLAKMESSAPAAPLSRALREGRWFLREVHDRLYRDEQDFACLRLRMVTSGVGTELLRLPPNDRLANNDRGVLDGFVGLARATDKQVLRFARRFGALELCAHGLPFVWHVTHLTRAQCERLELQQTDLYRRYAAKARAVLNVASLLHRQRVPGAADFASFEWTPTGVISAETARRAIEIEIRCWLLWGRVRPVVTWQHGDATVKLSGDGLWGALARQLAFAVTRTERWALCAGCGELFLPTRRPREGNRSWCSKSTCKHESLKRAKREYARRRLAAEP